MHDLDVGKHQPSEDEAGRTRRQATSEDGHAVRRALLALEAGSMALWQWDMASGEVEGDERFARLFGFEANTPVHAEEVFGRIHPDDLAEVQAKVEAATAPPGDDYEVEFRVCRPGDDPQWLGARGRVVEHASDGSPLSMIGVNWDLSELKAQEENLELLAKEMDHRVKNAFAVIRALITIGGRTAESKESLVEALGNQVQAMADAHRVTAGLARIDTRPRVVVPAEEVLRSALAPWLKSDGAKRSDLAVTIEADEDATLVPHQVSPLAMLAYELATNAAKHGPLGQDGGRLAVTVRALTAADGAENVAEDADTIERTEARELHLVWDETRDGTNATKDAEDEAERGTKGGFGSVLLQHCAGTLGAEIKRELRTEGLRVELRWPVRPL